MPILQMSERFYFLPTDKFIKRCHHWPGPLLSAPPEETQMEGDVGVAGRKAEALSSGRNQFLVTPTMLPLAVKALHQVQLGLLELLDLMEGHKEGVGTSASVCPLPRRM